MRPFVFVVAPNAFEDADAPGYEADFFLKTRSGHLASFSNLVRLFNRVGNSRPQLANRGKASRSLAGYYLESFLKTRGYDAHAVFAMDDAGAWARGSAAPTAVAVSTTFITTATELALTLRRVRSGVGPGVPIVVGGQFVWKQHLWGPDRFAGREELTGRPEGAHLFAGDGDPILREPVYVVSEFGEHTLLSVLHAFRRGARHADEMSGVPNLAGWTGAGWRYTERSPEPVDLDRDFTRWDLVDDMPAAMVPVRTSVGCPHRCEFCDFVAVHPRLRLRSPESIVEELRLAAARGATSIGFVDDNALSTRRRARELARAIAESELGLRWGGYLRADRVGEEEAVLLARSGLLYAWCGIESGDEEMLLRMRKRADLGAARSGIDALTGAGVHVLATFVLGFPGETRASVDASVSFLNGLRRDAPGAVEYLVFPFQVAPGSPVDRPERRRELGLTGLLDGWRHSTMCSEDVRSTWAPHFFRGVDGAGYTYYGGDNSRVWNAARRSEAVARRKELTVAFLDGAADAVVQERFAALHRLLCFTGAAPPDWRECLAHRDQQPSASAAPSSAPPRASANDGGA